MTRRIFRQYLDPIRKQFLARALLENRRRIPDTSKALGISETSVYMWILKYKLTSLDALYEASGIGPLEEGIEPCYKRHEREALGELLEKFNYNQSELARVMGVGRRAIGMKVKAFELKK